jgi:hypothetical protein
VTPEQEDQVRRALQAAAGGGEPATVPPEVASRLDDVLAELTASRAESSGPHDELARRRRRRWPNVLVAAASVVVIALAGGAVVTHGFGTIGSHADSSSAEPAASSQAPGSPAASAAPSGTTVPKASQRLHGLTAEGAAPAGLPRLRTSALAVDVRRVLRQQPATRAPADSLGCARPVTGHGDTLLAVRLDGRLATLLATPARGGRREARVYSCDDGGTPVASVSVAAR